MKDENSKLKAEIEELRSRLFYAEQSLEAIRQGEVDAFIVHGPHGQQMYSLIGPDHPYRIFIETMNEGAITLSKEGIILYANHRFADLVKLPLEQVIGSSFLQFIEESQRAQLVKLMQSKKGKEEFFLISNDGQALTVYISLQSSKHASIGSFYVLVTDITEKQRIQQDLTITNQKLEDALQTKNYFLSAMSHNLRTPLNSIIGFTDTLLMGLPGPLNKEQENQLKIVKRCSMHLFSLINQLLDLGRIENKKIDLILERVDVNHFIQDVIQELIPLAQAKHLQLTFSPLNRKIFLQTDKKILRQILINLLDNAIKYTDKGSIVVVEKLLSSSRKNYLDIQITDTGKGIKEENMDKIFEPYCKISEDEATIDHTGLGLYLSRKFSEILGIELNCQSIYEKGSTFILHIPLKGSL